MSAGNLLKGVVIQAWMSGMNRGLTPEIERLEQLEPAATLLRDVPDMTGQKIAVCSQHRSFLEGPFRLQKAASKLLTTPFYATLRR
jgi:hypothetical protein